MPDNHQIDHTFSYILANPPIDVNKLSPEGRKLVDDVRQLLEVVSRSFPQFRVCSCISSHLLLFQSRLQVHDKNADEALQKFIWHTSDERFRVTAKDKAHAIGDGSSLPAKEDAQRDGHQAVEHLRTLAQLLVTNSEARKLLSDLTFIARDLFATGATKAAEKARPDPESLAKVRTPPSGTNLSSNSQLTGDFRSTTPPHPKPGEVPSLKTPASPRPSPLVSTSRGKASAVPSKRVHRLSWARPTRRPTRKRRLPSSALKSRMLHRPPRPWLRVDPSQLQRVLLQRCLPLLRRPPMIITPPRLSNEWRAPSSRNSSSSQAIRLPTPQPRSTRGPSPHAFPASTKNAPPWQLTAPSNFSMRSSLRTAAISSSGA